MLIKAFLFTFLVIVSVPVIGQGLTKSDLPYYKKPIKKRPQLVVNDEEQDQVISADTIVVKRWKSILYSYERLKYLKDNGLITLKEMEDKEARLLIEIQKLRAIRSPKVQTIGASR
jgi:hypothetical protein